jgi:hypothetical protein
MEQFTCFEASSSSQLGRNKESDFDNTVVIVRPFPIRPDTLSKKMMCALQDIVFIKCVKFLLDKSGSQNKDQSDRERHWAVAPRLMKRSL